NPPPKEPTAPTRLAMRSRDRIARANRRASGVITPSGLYKRTAQSRTVASGMNSRMRYPIKQKPAKAMHNLLLKRLPNCSTWLFNYSTGPHKNNDCPESRGENWTRVVTDDELKRGSWRVGLTCYLLTTFPELARALRSQKKSVR